MVDGIIILAGGSGTRLWPLSRTYHPKHLIFFNDEEESLFQKTLKRALKLTNKKNICVVTNETQYFEIKKQMSLVEDDLVEEQIIKEKEGKNTLPAIILGLEKIFKENKNAKTFAVFSSDHYLEGKESWEENFKSGLSLAEAGKIITFGIVPFRPETGYGYIEKGDKISESGYNVKRFVEKPDMEKAKEYLENGNFYWNSGIFIFSVSTFIENLKEYQRNIFEIWEKSIEKNNFGEMYSELPSVSVDKGLLEYIPEKIAVIKSEFKWDDLGDWEAIYRNIGEKDSKNNVIWGDVIEKNCENCLLVSTYGEMVVMDQKNTVVVKTKDATLICSRNNTQEVKKIVEMLKEQGNPVIDFHTTVYRPWGSFNSLESNPNYKVKVIKIDAGASISLQRHYHRSEHWIVLSGTAEVEIDGKKHYLVEGQSIDIPKTAVHRLRNPGKIELEVAEIQLGKYIEETDIIRLEDNYGRI